jgi:peroxiredoxin
MSFAAIRKGALITLTIVATSAIAYAVGVYAAGVIATARMEASQRQMRANIISNLRDGIEIGQPLPDTEFISMTGKFVRLSQLVTRRTMIAYISPSCPHCLALIDSIAAVTAGRGETGGFILISSGDPDDLGKLKQDHGLKIPVLRDQAGEYNRIHLGVNSVPFCIVVDGSLIIQDLIPGPPEERLIKDLAGIDE